MTLLQALGEILVAFVFAIAIFGLSLIITVADFMFTILYYIYSKIFKS
jgi:hypothetical protein